MRVTNQILHSFGGPTRAGPPAFVLLLILVALSLPPVGAQTGCIGTTVGLNAASASIRSPSGIAVDSFGNLFVANNYFNNIVLVRRDASLAIWAGNGAAVYAGDGGSALAASLNLQAFTSSGVAVDAAGALYVSDRGSSAVRRVATPSGTITTFAGTPTHAGYSGDGAAATLAALSGPNGVAVDAAKNVIIADTANNVVRKVSAATGIISTIAGSFGLGAGFHGDGGQATAAQLNGPNSVAADAAGNVYIADTLNNVVRRVAMASGIISTFAGRNALGAGYRGDGGAATLALLNQPAGVAVDASTGAVFIADTFNNVIRAVLVSGTISTVAGNNSHSAGYGGDGGPALQAVLSFPAGITVDAGGNLYISDTSNNNVRKVLGGAASGRGTIALVAGNSLSILDGTAATATSFTNVADVAVDASTGSVFVVDSVSSIVRMVNASTGTVATVAGSVFAGAGYSGDGGPATAAQLNWPAGIDMNRTLAGGYRLFVADTLNNVVRLVSFGSLQAGGHGTSSIATIAGNWGLGAGFSGDGGRATSAQLNHPGGVAIDPTSGNLYVADTANSVIRLITLPLVGNPSSGTISTVAGNNALGAGYAGDTGPATSAQLNYPASIAVDPTTAGTYYIADTYNSLVREVALSAGVAVISTIAGSTAASGTSDSSSSSDTSAFLNYPMGVALYVDSSTSPATRYLYIADTFDQVVQKLTIGNAAVTTVAGSFQTGSAGDSGAASSAQLNQPTAVSTDRYGNLFIADSGNGAVRTVMQGTHISCPAGSSCLCGTPVPCTDSRYYCPANVLTAVNVASGYFAASTQVANGTGPSAYGGPGPYTQQSMCPLGYFCSSGAITPCAVGTYGPAPLSVAATSCLPCPANTYGPLLAQTNTQSCFSCPPQSASAGRSFYCGWQVANADNVLPGPFGAAGAFTLPDAAHLSVTSGGAAVDMELAPTLNLVNDDSTAPKQVVVAVPLALLIASPAVLWFAVWAVRLLCCCSCARRGTHIVLERALNPVLRACDQMGDWKVGTTRLGMPVHWEGTELGGSLSLAAVAVIAAFCSVIIIQFNGSDNQIVSKYVLPALPSSLDDSASLPFTSLPASATLNGLLPTSGFGVLVAASGPLCGRATVGVTNLDTSSSPFLYSVSSYGPANASGYVHAFTCAACVFDALSSLPVAFDGTCQSLAVFVASVGAQGAVTAYARLAQPAAASGSYITGATLVVTPAVEVVVNAVSGAAGRGILLSNPLWTVTSQALAAPPAAVTLTVSLQASATYSGVEVDYKFFAVDLVYQLLAVFAFGGFFTYAFMFVIERFKRLELLERQHEEQAALKGAAALKAASRAASLSEARGGGEPEALQTEDDKPEGEEEGEDRYRIPRKTMLRVFAPGTVVPKYAPEPRLLPAHAHSDSESSEGAHRRSGGGPHYDTVKVHPEVHPAAGSPASITAEASR